jgi:glycosyltransferase involved in cell wall biosynthesis
MSGSIRVAFVHDSFPVYRRRLFQLLAGRFDIRFFFVNENPGLLPPGSESARGIRIPEMSDYVVAPALFARILAAHRRAPFDAVLCPEPAAFSSHAAWCAARMIGRPYVVFSGEWYPARHPRRRLTGPLERAIVRGAASCLAYGTRVRDKLAAMGADPAGIFITGNASDYRFTPVTADDLQQARIRWGLGSGPVVLFLGRLLPFKAPDVLIDAFSIVRNETPSSLLIAGNGPLFAGLRRRAERLGLRDVHFTGSEVRRDGEKDLLYSLASVFALPSRKGRTAEPWGLVLNEAASAGVPIVTTDGVGASGDLIRDGETGLVVKAGDSRALAAAIATLLRSPEAAREYGSRARSQAAKFTVERMADAFGLALERAAGGKA